MAISRNQLVKELEPGLNALFGLEYKQYEQEHAEIYNTESSDRAFEEEVMLSGFAQAQVKPEGSGIAYDSAEDNLYDRLASRYTKALARSMAQTKQVKAAAPLNNGLPGGSFQSGDGVTLFNASHPTISGTFSNTLATAADLNETSLEQAMIDIAALTDERGLKIAAKAVKMIIPSALQFTADRLMNSAQRVGTADNDINALRNMGMVPGGYTVNHYLTDTDAFYITTDVPNGMKHMERAPLTTKMEGDFDTGNVRYKARERYVFGVSDPRGIFASPGA
jgi:hypothetical protein